MKEIDDIIEAFHQEASECRCREYEERPASNVYLRFRSAFRRPLSALRAGWQYVAVGAAVVTVVCIVLWPKQKESQYAYSQTSSGVKVFCEENCNADGVVARMESVMKTLCL